MTATSGFINMIDFSGMSGSALSPAAELHFPGTRQLRDAQGNLVANSYLQGDDLSDPFAEPGDNLNINPAQPMLSKTKDIGLGISNSGYVTISEVRQSFPPDPRN